ncbi:WD40 repeat-like protein [Gyrodon lividus]|nr:WD40 repeat-like protein [Gyrodon lividus]
MDVDITKCLTSCTTRVHEVSVAALISAGRLCCARLANVCSKKILLGLARYAPLHSSTAKSAFYHRSLATMSDTSKKSVDLTPKLLMTMSGHEHTVLNMAYLPGGERVVTCSNDGTVRIWNVEDGEQEGTSMEHGDWVNGLAVTRDGKRILSGGGDNKMKVWDVETYEFIEEWEDHTGGISCIAMSPDDQLVASAGHGGKIVIRKMKKGGQIKHAIQAGSSVWSVSFSPNGEKVAAGVRDRHGGHVIRVYDVESGKLILRPIKGHTKFVNCVLWSLDGCRLFSASDDRSIRCWNSETGEPIGQQWTGHTHWVFYISLSHDGTKLASASYDHTVRFWDAHSGEPIEQPLQHDNWLCAVIFSPSGEFVACGGDDKKLSIWRVPWWDHSQKQPSPLPKAYHTTKRNLTSTSLTCPVVQ